VTWRDWRPVFTAKSHTICHRALAEQSRRSRRRQRRRRTRERSAGRQRDRRPEWQTAMYLRYGFRADRSRRPPQCKSTRQCSHSTSPVLPICRLFNENSCWGQWTALQYWFV